jgi:serine/threonine-protein kinase
VVGEKYRIERVLGAGGMGIVVAATHLTLQRTVALKFLRRERLQARRDLARFLREARFAARMTGPHVARILDAGTLRAGGADAPYIALEYLDGVDLARLLARCRRLPPATIAAIVSQACEALAEAHALGIVHRDVKPANLFLIPSGNGLAVKVLDFGVAKWRSDPDALLTTTESVVGSPAYMAPEQMRQSRAVDERSDLWSLGVILHEAVAGRLPFEAPAYADLCLRVLLDPVPPLPEDAGTPPGFEAVVRRCLEKEPERRFASAGELRDALLPFAERAAPAALADLVALGSEAAPEASYPSAIGSNTARELEAVAPSVPAPPQRRRRALLALGGGAAISALVAAWALAGEPPAVAREPAAAVVAAPAQAPPAVDAAAAIAEAAPPDAAPPPSPPPKRRRPRPAAAPAPAWDPLASPY